VYHVETPSQDVKYRIVIHNKLQIVISRCLLLGFGRCNVRCLFSYCYSHLNQNNVYRYLKYSHSSLNSLTGQFDRHIQGITIPDVRRGLRQGRLDFLWQCARNKEIEPISGIADVLGWWEKNAIRFFLRFAHRFFSRRRFDFLILQFALTPQLICVA
jgi:hypothetical protein